MQRKLDWLSPISEQPDNYGNVYVNMKFDDGTLAYKAGKPSDMAQHYADLLGIQMAGELVEIELEDTGKKTQKGATKYKLVGYPGWSAPVAQGGKAQANANGKSYGNSWYNSEEGVHFTQERMDRRTALMQAVEATGDPGHWEIAADAMYEWLQKSMRGEGQQDAEVPITERTTDPIPVSTSEGSRSSGTGAAGSPARNRASEETSAVANGEGSAADESEGVGVSTGGSKRASTPEDNPWEGMGV